MVEVLGDYIEVLISGGYNERVPLYTEVSSLQEVGIEGVPLYTELEVSSFQGVGIEEFHCIQRYPHFRGF